MADNPERPLPRPFEMHRGKGRIVEEAVSNGEWHQPCIQLLEYDGGGTSVRFCSYNRTGRFQRSPLMVGEDDIIGLRDALDRTPRLRSMLQELVG